MSRQTTDQRTRWRSVRMCVDDTGRLYVEQGEDREQGVWVLETTVTPTQATPGDKILI